MVLAADQTAPAACGTSVEEALLLYRLALCTPRASQSAVQELGMSLGRLSLCAADLDQSHAAAEADLPASGGARRPPVGGSSKSRAAKRGAKTKVEDNQAVNNDAALGEAFTLAC